MLKPKPFNWGGHKRNLMNARRPQRTNKIDYGKWPDRSWLQESKQKVQDASNHKKLSTTRSHWPQEVNDCKNPKVAISWWLQEINKHKNQMTARNQQLQEIDYCQNPMTSRTNDCRNLMTAKKLMTASKNCPMMERNQWPQERTQALQEAYDPKKLMTARCWWLQDANDYKNPTATRTQWPQETDDCKKIKDHKKMMTTRTMSARNQWLQEPNCWKIKTEIITLCAGIKILLVGIRSYWHQIWLIIEWSIGDLEHWKNWLQCSSNFNGCSDISDMSRESVETSSC